MSEKYAHYYIALLLWGIAMLGWPITAQAGIYDSNTEITYTQYWVDHEEFIGKCSEPKSGGNEWYIEPTSGCQITLDFNIAEDPAQATKIEIFLDLWRNHTPPRAKFKINSGPWHQTNVGNDWSRTPYIATIPTSEFVQGDNTITFTNNGYHVHDIAFRIFGTSSQGAPSGSLGNIKDDNSTKPLSGGGTLNVNNDQLELSATVGAGAKFLEFHAFYDGYDEDNDGVFRDWHNLSRNNWNPGGTDEFSPKAALGSTINHVGTVAVSGAGTYSVTWNIPHIINQSGVKFKIRVLDDNGKVREAAGGVSNGFTIARNIPVVYFTNPSFEDIILWHDGDYPATASTTVTLPNLDDFDAGYLIGAYWLRPNIYFNGDPQTFANRYNPFPGYPNGTDDWALSILSAGNTGTGQIPWSKLQSGENSFLFENRTGAWGSFVENPGPMIVLRGKSNPPTDTTAPAFISSTPTDAATGVAVDTNIKFRLVDYNSGLDLSTLSVDVVPTTSASANVAIAGVSSSGSSNDMTFTYNPPSDFTDGEDVTVTVNVSDVAGNPMPPQSFTFTIFVPDNTPPAISNIQCVPGSDKLTIVWTTDELATSVVNYGPTAGLGSTITDATLVTAHSVQMTGLASETEYHYTVFSQDGSANGATEPAIGTLTCTTAGPSSLVSDDFNSCALDTNLWAYADPLALATMTATGTQIKFEIPAGQNYDAWTTGNNGARIMQPANNANFEIDVKFETGITAAGQIQGVLIQQDSDTFLRVSFGLDNSNVARVYAYFVDGASSTSKVGSNGRPLDTSINPNGPLYLRVWRQSPTLWTIFYSGDGITWLQAGGYSFTQAISVSSIGAFAGNANGASAYTSIVDYFFRTDLPISPEDGTALQLGTTVSPLNTGVILKGTTCGNPVELTAEPIPGWSFVNWTSIASSVMTTTNPVSVTYPYNEVVTANFEQNFYELFTAVEDGLDGQTGGTVSATAPASSQGYIYDEVVAITAAPANGWQFDGWEGAASGADLSTTVTMTNNRSITANFSQIPYAIDVTITGQGAVVTDPATGPYYLNNTVAMTATAAPGWTFAGWGGDLTGNNLNPVLTISGNHAVTALFTQDQYILAVGIAGTGSGTAMATPDQATYLYGDQVTLTATANPGSTFAGWSGTGLSSTDATVAITMDQSASVVATFTQDYYVVTAGAATGGTINLSASALSEGYIYNELVTVSAVAEPGYIFQNWTGALTSSTTPDLLPVTGNHAVGAVFAREYYQINITQKEGGTVSITPPADTQGYVYGEEFTLKVESMISGYTFDGWSGPYGDMLEVTEFVYGNLTIEPTFTLDGTPTFVLSYEEGEGGSISVNPVRSDNQYIQGTIVMLSATAEDGYVFTNWADGQGNVVSTDTDYEVAMNGDISLKANFSRLAPNEFTLSKNVVGNGAINATPDNVSYVAGSNVSLTAVAQAGWSFNGWSGDLSGSDAAVTLTITANSAVTATFTREYYAASTVVVGNGSIAISAPPSPLGYIYDEPVTLTATAESGWIFAGWESSEGATTADNPATIAIKSSTTFTATFVEEGDTVTGMSVTTDGQGNVRMMPEKAAYAEGEEITFTAEALPGWRFVRWETTVPLASGGETDPSITIRATNDMSIKAIFEEVGNELYLPIING